MIQRQRDALAGEPGAAMLDRLAICIAAERFGEQKRRAFAQVKVQRLCGVRRCGGQPG